MKHFPRRQFLHLAAGAAALPAVSHVARAQAYPTRPVRVLVGYPPGGVNDTYARLIGRLRQSGSANHSLSRIGLARAVRLRQMPSSGRLPTAIPFFLPPQMMLIIPVYTLI